MRSEATSSSLILRTLIMKPSNAVLSIVVLALVAAAPSDPRPGAHRVLPLQELSIGSHEAKKGEFPFQVTLQENREHVCGASIISHHTLVTAAHCFGDEEFLNPEAVAGDHNLAEEEGTEQRRNISRVIKHQNYTFLHDFGYGFPINDIAVVLLEQPFVFNEFVQPVPLARPGAVISGPITLSGWGLLKGSYVGKMPHILRTEDLPVVNHEECIKAMETKAGFKHYMLPDTMLCTGPLSGGMGPCAGDSGSPMVQNGVLVGIVSWGPKPCGVANFPYGNTNVSSFTDWIIRSDLEIRRPAKRRERVID